MSQRQASLSALAEGNAVYPRAGYGYGVAHHGEIMQGVLEDSSGQLRRCLISLICPMMVSEATFRPGNTKIITVSPRWKTKAQSAAALTLRYLRLDGEGGHLTIESSIPIRWGLGSSTSDVTAVVRATAATFGVTLSAKTIAEIAVQAETASDPLMFGARAVLFAHREGCVIEDFGGALPPLYVLGFNTDPTGVGIDTLSYSPARYTWWEIEAFRPLIGLMRQAVQTQSARLVGRVATASARINQRYLSKPCFDEIETLAEKVGALGIQVAHSGTVIGLLFDPDEHSTPHRVDTAQAILRELGFTSTWQFKSGGDDAMS